MFRYIGAFTEDRRWRWMIRCSPLLLAFACFLLLDLGGGSGTHSGSEDTGLHHEDLSFKGMEEEKPDAKRDVAGTFSRLAAATSEARVKLQPVFQLVRAGGLRTINELLLRNGRHAIMAKLYKSNKRSLNFCKRLAPN